MAEVCVLCEEGFDQESSVQVHKKGLNTLIRISEERELHDLCRYCLFIHTLILYTLSYILAGEIFRLVADCLLCILRSCSL